MNEYTAALQLWNVNAALLYLASWELDKTPMSHAFLSRRFQTSGPVWS